MRTLCLVLALSMAACCTTPDARVLKGATVLHKNTVKLGAGYEKLLDSTAPVGTATIAGVDSRGWTKHKKHQKALIRANAKLATRMLEWTQKAAKSEK